MILAKCYQFGCVLDVLRVLIASKLYGLSVLTVIRIISKVYESKMLKVPSSPVFKIL